jgi:DNA-binding CsgD family transcriptional regulator
MWAHSLHNQYASQETWISAIDTLLQADTFPAFTQFLQKDLRNIVPHHTLLCGIGRANGHAIENPRLLMLDFPVQYLWDTSNAEGALTCPIMRGWLNTRRVQLFDARIHAADVDQTWLECFNLHGLRNVAAHGIQDLESQVTSFFVFCRIPQFDAAYYRQALRLIVPQLHSALMPWINRLQLLPENPKEQSYLISDREVEVLNWLVAGKSNEQIGRLLGVTENTARSHVRNLFRKLGVRHRAQVRLRNAMPVPFVNRHGEV